MSSICTPQGIAVIFLAFTETMYPSSLEVLGRLPQLQHRGAHPWGYGHWCKQAGREMEEDNGLGPRSVLFCSCSSLTGKQNYSSLPHSMHTNRKKQERENAWNSQIRDVSLAAPVLCRDVFWLRDRLLMSLWTDFRFFFFFLTAFLKVLASLPFRHDFRMRSSYIASLRLVDLTSNPLRCLWKLWSRTIPSKYSSFQNWVVEMWSSTGRMTLKWWYVCFWVTR